MLNIQKYENDIREILPHNFSVQVDSGAIAWCAAVGCDKNCKFYDGCGEKSCSERRLAWLLEEFKEPEVDWSMIPVDAPIYVSHNGDFWQNRHFARYEDGKVYAWAGGTTSWSKEGCKEPTIWNYARLAEVK